MMTPSIEIQRPATMEPKFGPGMPYSGKDGRILTSHINRKLYDIIIFTDSRGSAISSPANIDQCWPDIVIEHLRALGLSYLLISRPRDITVFFTLINFFELNDINCKYLITNVGFVDLTPKKKTIVDDILAQLPASLAETHIPYILFDPYILSDGSVEALYSLDYSYIYPLLAAFLRRKFKETILIETLECAIDIAIPRKRPTSFFSQLRSTNKLLQQIASSDKGIHFLNTFAASSYSDIDLTYDAVHYTPLGHQLLSAKLLQHLATLK